MKKTTLKAGVIYKKSGVIHQLVFIDANLSNSDKFTGITAPDEMVANGGFSGDSVCRVGIRPDSTIIAQQENGEPLMTRNVFGTVVWIK